jgi:MoxR-like ATPase
MTIDYRNDVEALQAFTGRVSELKKEIAKVIIGQDVVVDQLLTSIFSRGHCLLIGVPGLAKTLMINTLSQVLDLAYNRIQFTPDLMPSDILGTEILGEDRRFKFIKGPVFANIILADEINRTPPKTQSALLEAMQERAVTVAGTTYPLSAPFFVLATQNPIEQEGTYPLPEAQLDRFMFSVWLDYPPFDQEVEIVKSTTGRSVSQLQRLLHANEILYFQDLLTRIPVTDNVYEYAVTLATRTRPGRPGSHPMANEFLSWGAGPRASQYLIIGAKVNAAFRGKFSPDIDDVKAMAHAVLQHRIIRNYKAEAEEVSVAMIIDKLMEV